MHRNKNLLFTALIIGFFNIHHIAFAQTEILDPAGYVNKYDTAFKGIGPKVYVLPAPRSKADRLKDTYKELINFQDSINKGIQANRLILDFKSTSNQEALESLITEIPDNNESWKQTIDKYTAEKDSKIVYKLLNERARQLFFKNRQLSKSQELLSQALALAPQNSPDAIVLESNLASVYLLQNKLDDAFSAEEKVYAFATKESEKVDQANSLVKLAMIDAQKNNNQAAENTIIRKAIPLYNKSKNHEGKINAWITLAKIYRKQNRYTEAQWFLIQAKELAENKDFKTNLALIEFMLGSSKLSQHNYKVAEKELQNALSLVAENDKYLRLAIVEQLGSTLVKLKKYDEADQLLNEYWLLREELF